MIATIGTMAANTGRSAPSQRQICHAPETASARRMRPTSCAGARGSTAARARRACGRRSASTPRTGRKRSAPAAARGDSPDVRRHAAVTAIPGRHVALAVEHSSSGRCRPARCRGPRQRGTARRCSDVRRQHRHGRLGGRVEGRVRQGREEPGRAAPALVRTATDSQPSARADSPYARAAMAVQGAPLRRVRHVRRLAVRRGARRRGGRRPLRRGGRRLGCVRRRLAGPLRPADGDRAQRLASVDDARRAAPRVARRRARALRLDVRHAPTIATA